jgi:hypothetical protein
MSLVPSLLTAAFHALRPGGPAIRSWSELAERPEVQHASLAIVGNAGYLAELSQGARIDAHDLVLRMNNFRLAGFERQVGRKLDIFFTTFHQDVDLTNPPLEKARFIATSVPFNVLKRPVGLQQRHASFVAAGVRRLSGGEAYVPDTSYFVAARRTIGRYPSTGAMAILLAIDFLLPVCGQIFVTGFSFFEGQGHYFHSGPVVPRNHDPRREMDFVRAKLERPVASGRVQLDPRMSQQLGFSGRDRRAA